MIVVEKGKTFTHYAIEYDGYAYDGGVEGARPRWLDWCEFNLQLGLVRNCQLIITGQLVGVPE